MMKRRPGRKGHLHRKRISYRRCALLPQAMRWLDDSHKQRKSCLEYESTFRHRGFPITTIGFRCADQNTSTNTMRVYGWQGCQNNWAGRNSWHVESWRHAEKLIVLANVRYWQIMLQKSPRKLCGIRF
jgi:hypothetical protein